MKIESIDDDVPLLREPFSLAEERVFEDRLRALLGALQSAEDSAEVHGLEPSGGTRNQLDDEAVEETALATELGALDAEEELGYAVRDALRRIRDGTFGTCGDCGEWISRERLQLVPYARLCSPCATGRG